MGYVAIRGGEEAIVQAAQLLDYLRAEDGDQAPLSVEMIQQQLRHAHSRVLSEGGLYHPHLAALAIKQAMGDTLEASFYLRAYRSTRPRLGETPVHRTDNMRLIRRISSAFKDIPGGQVLGPTPDFMQRLFRIELLDETEEDFRDISRKWLEDMPPVHRFREGDRVMVKVTENVGEWRNGATAGRSFSDGNTDQVCFL